MSDEELIARLRDLGFNLTDAAAARIEELTEERDYTEGTNDTLIAINQALTTKLAKAVETLDKINVGEGWAAQEARTTLAEIKGESHE